jgi:hypothetical protein
VVARIRREHAHGASLGEIARRLNRDDIPTGPRRTPMVAVNGAGCPPPPESAWLCLSGRRTAIGNPASCSRLKAAGPRRGGTRSQVQIPAPLLREACQRQAFAIGTT